MSWFDDLSPGWLRYAIPTATIVLAVALPATLALNSPSRRANEPLHLSMDDGHVDGAEPVTAKPIAPAQGLPVGRWEVRGEQSAGQRVAAIELGENGHFTGTSSSGQTTFTGTWGGETGTLKATGTSVAQPSARFECELVYVEATQSPQSSYVLGDCRGARDRWTLELYRAKAR